LGIKGYGACDFCYSSDIAGYRSKNVFTRAFVPEQLEVPFKAIIPKKREDEPGIHNVLVCSMVCELWSHLWEQMHLEMIMTTIREARMWNFLFLTRTPAHFIDIDWSTNCWVGTIVENQTQVRSAEQAFKHVKASVKFVYCKPSSEELVFSNLSVFRWVLINSIKGSTSACQPVMEWIDSLVTQARKAGCSLYIMPNRDMQEGGSDSKEYPGEQLTLSGI
jgi:protein gp37